MKAMNLRTVFKYGGFGARERAGRFLDVSRAGAFLRAYPRWNGLLVLNYHRIGDAAETMFDWSVFSATPAALDAQLGFLKRQVDIIGPDDIELVLRQKRGRFAMLTFDDGYRDNYDQAFPLLKAHGVTATFFICTSLLDQGRVAWWDEIAWMVRSSQRSGLPASTWVPKPLDFDEPDREGTVRVLLARYKTLPGDQTAKFLAWLAEATGSGRCDVAARDVWITWDNAREMVAAGMTCGGHTVNHPILSRLPREEQDVEIAGSKQRLEAELGRAPLSFAYPVGWRDAFDEHTRASLRAHEFKYGFSFYGGYRQATDWDPYDIRRAYISPDITMPVFRAIVTIPQIFAR